ncbi:MAG: HEAT repeat domain-containing protein [Phycisphaeraceae bacterium]|nr:HEAT repeat domain-containing protein [Phycisphaeraceae bacterium]
MSPIETLYQELARCDDVSVDRALADALPTASPADRPRMARLLIERGRPEGCLGLVLHYDLLEPPLQDQIAEQAPALVRPIRQALALTRSKGPLHAILLIRRGLAARLAYLVTGQLRSGDAKLTAPAADCLLHLAQKADTSRHNGMPAAIDPASATQLLSAIEEAVIHFAAHHQPQVLIALCYLLPRSAQQSAQVLANPEHAAVAPMRNLLSRAEQPAVRRSLLWMAAIPTLTEPALTGLRCCAATGQIGESLELAHLLALPHVSKPLLRVHAPDELWPSDQQMRQMTAAQLRMLPRWAAALNFDDAQRLVKLTNLARVADPPTRLAALRQLLAMSRQQSADTGAIDDAVARFASDSDAQIASMAVWHLLHRRYRKLPQMLASLTNSPHQKVRHIAAKRLAPIGFERLWDHWTKLTSEQRRSAGRALIKIDPGFHRMLGERLARSQRDDRLRALSVIHELNQASFFTTPLIQLLGDEDEYIVSAAVSALGSAEGPAAISALRGALDHRDSRVRANAVEALARLETSDHVHQLIRIASEDANRPRANAIAALMALRTDEALTALQSMLDDHRSEHRCSALWLVEHLSLIDVVRNVAEMSISDPDEPTRQRAGRVVHDLIQAMNGEPLQSIG